MISTHRHLPAVPNMKHMLSGALALALFTQAAAAQQTPPIRQLGEPSTRSTEKFGAIVSVRAIPGGVLVNDIRNRRVLLLDSTLSRTTVVADTTAATANAYSGPMASLIAYRQDSTLFVDPQSMSMLVIDPTGQVGRVMSVPRSQDAMMFGSAMGGAAYDGHGGLVYRGSPFGGMQMRRAPGGPGGFQPPEIPDTTPVLRVDLASRRVDTLGFMKVPQVKMDVQRDTMGRVSISAIVNPLPTVDDFAVLSDGSVALIRGRDYHVDWIRPDGARESTPKIPFEWRRLSEEDKIAFLDSVKAARQRMDEQARAQRAADSASHGRQGGRGQPDMVGAMAGGPPGAVRVQIGGPGGGAGPMMGGTAGLNLVQASDLPDYQPVFFSGSARADADGNLWVRTVPTRSLPGGPVYDVINAKGQLVDRVQVPKDRTIAGFAPGGVVYLSTTQENVTTIERATYRRD